MNLVHLICWLDRSIYAVVEHEILSGNVILTDERIEHIKEHHPNDYELFIRYIPQVIEDPDYI
ncbi:MAG: minor capsid protein, partial [Selenomonas sp.]|nr:minor capsid protein [Selenomonas sp.]